MSLDSTHVTDAPAPHHFARAAELLPRTLLAAHLEDAAGLHRRIPEHHAFGVRHGERLLQIHILAGMNGGQRDFRVRAILPEAQTRIKCLQ